MMDSITVKNFKCFKDLKINSLSQVNLIVGMNNVGKSALLEAISVFASKGDVRWIDNLLTSRVEREIDRRGDSDFNLKDFIERYQSLFNNFNFETSENTKICISDGINNMTIQMLPFVNTEINGEEKRKILRDNFDKEQFDGIVIESVYNADSFFFDYNRIRRFIPLKTIHIPLKFVRTTDIKSDNNASLYDNVALTNDEYYIVKALNIINDKISKINFISETTGYKDVRNPFVVINGDKRRYRLSSMGDGMNRILTIILSMLNSKNGVFLVDEFENGLHHSVQQKLWEMIFYLAKELDIQVFATTHSDDCIKSFIKADKNNQGKLIRLERHEENINAIPFNDRERLEFAIENDIEIR